MCGIDSFCLRGLGTVGDGVGGIGADNHISLAQHALVSDNVSNLGRSQNPGTRFLMMDTKVTRPLQLAPDASSNPQPVNLPCGTAHGLLHAILTHTADRPRRYIIKTLLCPETCLESSKTKPNGPLAVHGSALQSDQYALPLVWLGTITGAGSSGGMWCDVTEAFRKPAQPLNTLSLTDRIVHSPQGQKLGMHCLSDSFKRSVFIT